MKKRKSVALLIETSNAYSRGILNGIVSYIHEHEPWSVVLPEQERGATPPLWLRNWDGDGLIVRIESVEIAKSIRKLKKPVIDVSAARQIEGIPWVETNDAKISELAFAHFVERGFKRLAFCGDPDFNWSRWREAEFVRLAAEANMQCEVFNTKSRLDPSYSWTKEKRRLQQWLISLPQPTGIFACYDVQAQKVIDACRECEIHVPEALAILGVDNDELLCNLCSPPLSSIIPDARRTGREAAKLLDILMSGEAVTEDRHLIEPTGVATRQSTDILAIEDVDIAAAVRYIRDHACDGILVADILKIVPLSRRVLESRFQAILGRTPHQEITRQRVERVRTLLIETDMTLAKIAEKTGFQHEEYMSVAFRRAMKVPPGKFRRQATI